MENKTNYLKIKLITYPIIIYFLRFIVSYVFRSLPMFKYDVFLFWFQVAIYIVIGFLLGDVINLEKKIFANSKFFLIIMLIPIVYPIFMWRYVYIYKQYHFDLNSYLSTSLILIGFYLAIFLKGLWYKLKNK